MTWRKRVFLTVISGAAPLVAAALAAAMLPENQLLSLYGLGLLVFPTGRFVTLLPIIHQRLPFSPFFLAGCSVLIESCIALFVVTNLEVLHKFPWVGSGLRDMEKNGRATLSRRPWIRRMAFLGVVVFVSIPVPGTGAVGGTVVARLVGLGLNRSFGAVLMGTVVGAYGMAMGASTLAKVISPERDSTWFGILRFGIIIITIVLLSWLGRRRIDTAE
jgi:uncharacterized membrane protein